MFPTTGFAALSLCLAHFYLDTTGPVKKSYEELVAAVAGAIVGAIVGALLTGWVTYFFTKQAEKNRQAELVLKLYSMLVLELCDHSFSLALEVDAILPVWLLRGHWETLGGSRFLKLRFARPAIRLNKLRDEYEKRFIAELLYSELIAELEFYYRLVRSRNETIDLWDDVAVTVSANECNQYVRSTAQALTVVLDLIGKIRSVRGIEKQFTAGHVAQLENLDHSKQRLLNLLELTKMTQAQLQHLEIAAEFEALTPEERQQQMFIGAKSPDISEIPERIRTDPTKLWVQFLQLARDIETEPFRIV